MAGSAFTQRLNVGGVQLIAQQALRPCTLAGDSGKHRPAAHTVVVVSGGVERRHAALDALGRRCARQFNAVVVYEEPAGRGAAESLGCSARVILEGARQCASADHQRHCKLDMVHALRFALSLCQPGDVVVFACAPIDQLFHALRAVAGPRTLAA